MGDSSLTLRIELDAGEGAGDEERDEAVRALQRDLLELEVDGVERPVAPAPSGTRSGEAAIAVGTIVVALGPHALTAVGAAVRAWIVRRRGRRVALELDGDRIELSGATEDEMRRLVEAFVSRHERP